MFSSHNVARKINVGHPPSNNQGGPPARLTTLPHSDITPDEDSEFLFLQNLAYDTSLIRRELGFTEIVSYKEGIRRTFARWQNALV